jgi:ATP-dependent DNA helicase RecG
LIHEPCVLLDRLLREPGENAWLEFKVNNADLREIGEYVSALANAAMLAGRDQAFLVFGIENKTKRRVGTTVRLSELKQGNENLANWLSRLLEPRLVLDMADFECDGLPFAIIGIDPAYERPVRLYPHAEGRLAGRPFGVQLFTLV